MTRTIITINKSFREQPGLLASAIGHVSQGIGAQAGLAAAQNMATYIDLDGHEYPNISHYPVISLTTNASKMWRLWDALEQNGAVRSVYLNTMINGGHAAQLAGTKTTARSELIPIVIGCFGDDEGVSELTRKFSLYK